MITPKQAHEKAKPDITYLKKLEEIIDKEIIEGIKASRTQVTIDVKLFPSRIIMNTIIDNYTSSGWKIKSIYDQREGDYVSIELTYKKK